MKRYFDIAAAIVGLVLASPIILVCMAAVRITSPGPTIFRQMRVGLHERPFTCLKLRTMYRETPDAPSHETRASAVTPIGRHLRRFKLDELPQLWNILVGDMSFVGPRPCLPSQNVLIKARRRYGLQFLRPGITGVSQVAGVDMSVPERLAELDATYLTDMSVRTDMRLICETVLGAGRGDRVQSGERR
jgi:O-antigen biosynthesis protein WbqP